MKNLAVVIFLYPNALKYLDKLLENIVSQSVQPSSVLIFNDGVNDLEGRLSKSKMNYQIYEVTGTPFEIRLRGFEILSDLPFDAFVFQDADDLMSLNRLEEAAKNLLHYGVVVNDLDIMTNEGICTQNRIWHHRFKHNKEFSVSDILTKNFIGLGNTAVRKEMLFNIKSPKTIKPLAADWFIFYQIMEENEIIGCFISECTSLYRQHSENIAGLSHLNKARMTNALKVKGRHYDSLSELGFNLEKPKLELDKQKELIKSYRIGNNRNLNHFFWWEETKILHEEL